MLRRPHDRIGGTDLDDLAAMHHGDAIGEMRDDRDVVRDEQVRDTEAIAQVGEQVDDRGLHRDVERRDRLVAHDEARVGGERARDADALLLAAAHLVGVAVGVVRRQPHQVEQRRDARGDLRARRKAEARDRPPEQLAHGLARVERGVGVLEHDLRGAPHRLERALRLSRHDLARDGDRAGRRLDQAQDGAPERGLARAELADQPQHLAGRDGERDVVDRLQLRPPPARDQVADEAAGLRERLRHAADVDDRRCVRSGRRLWRMRLDRPGDIAQRPHIGAAHAAFAEIDQRLRRRALGRRERAAGGKPAAGGRNAQIGEPARNGGERALFLSKPRDRGQQALAVGVHRRAQHLAGAPLLDDLAGVEHRDFIGDPPHHAEIVADEQHGEAAPVAQRLEQVEDLRLDRDIERGGRLVEDQKLGLGRERARDQRALAHAAGKLMRVGARHARGIDDADLVEQLDRARMRRSAREAAMVHQRLAHLLADAQRRVEHRERILEHEAHPRAAQGAARGRRHREHVVALEQDPAAGNASFRRQQPHRGERDRALAGAGFADQCERRALCDGERDRRQRLDLAGGRPIADREVVDRQHGSGRAGARLQPRVEPFARAVAEQVDADHQQAHRKAGRERDPRRAVEEGARLGDHQPPVGARRLRAQPEKAQRGAEQDRVGDAQARLARSAAARHSAGSRGTGCSRCSRRAPSRPG